MGIIIILFDQKIVKIIHFYNKYLKSRLGNKRVINCLNFINLLKEESNRSIENLINIKNYNIQYKLNRTNLKINIKKILNLKKIMYIKK